jgi:hypothetical protein
MDVPKIYGELKRKSKIESGGEIKIVNYSCLTPMSLFPKKSTKLRHVKTSKERKKTRSNEINGTDETDAISCFRTNVPSSVRCRPIQAVEYQEVNVHGYHLY